MSKQVIALRGIVQTVARYVPKQPTRFTVITENRNVVKLVSYDYIPVQEYDSIVASCRPATDNEYLIDLYTIEPIESKDAVVASISNYVKSIKRDEAARMYTDIHKQIMQAGRSITVAEHLDQMAIAFKTIPDLPPRNHELGISLKQYQILMMAWYKQRLVRSLKLLGMDDRMISDSLELISDIHVLIKKVKTNPLTVAPIPIDLAKTIIKRVGKFSVLFPDGNDSPTNKFVQCGLVLRQIYGNMKYRQWTCTPATFVSVEHYQLADLFDLLLDEYDLEFDRDHFYLKKPFEVEMRLTRYFSNQQLESDIVHNGDVVFENPCLTDEQKTAIRGAFANKFSVITGGGGTGKTTIIKEIVRNCELANTKCVVVSFTGKAVARVKEVIPRALSATMHRMMGRPVVMDFRHLIIDESSMVTSELLDRFLQRFPHTMRITLVGDCNQLEPIGWGAVFFNLIGSKRVPVFTLTKNHRSTLVGRDGINGILDNASAIVEVIKLKKETSRKIDVGEFHFVPSDNFWVQPMGGSIESLIVAMKNQGISHKDFVIVSPYSKNILKRLNTMVQAIYMPPTYTRGIEYHMDYHGGKWALGDRVMMKTNNYDINVMNGEEGYITSLSGSGTAVDPYMVHVTWNNGAVVKFVIPLKPDNPLEDAVSEYDENIDLSDDTELTISWIMHSMAITVHRSQGSEWPHVVAYMEPQAGRTNSSFINSNMVYTMITRPKFGCYVIGDYGQLEAGAYQLPPWRCDLLAERLQEADIQTHQPQIADYAHVSLPMYPSSQSPSRSSSSTQYQSSSSTQTESLPPHVLYQRAIDEVYELQIGGRARTTHTGPLIEELDD